MERCGIAVANRGGKKRQKSMRQGTISEGANKCDVSCGEEGLMHIWMLEAVLDNEISA